MITLLNHDECTEELAGIFIQKALAKLQRTLRVPAMEGQLITTVGDVFSGVDIPNDYLEEKELYVPGLGGILKKKTLDYINSRFSYRGVPLVYTREGSKLKVWPNATPDLQIVLNYYAEFPPLEADTDTNWISTLAPDVVETCALTFAADHFIDERKMAWEGAWTTGAMEIQAQADSEATAGAMVISAAYDLGDGS